MTRSWCDAAVNPWRKAPYRAAMFILLCFSTLAQAEKVTVNLKDADIEAVIRMVAEKTGRNFIVDPRVKGKVNITSSKPLESAELYQLLLAVLDVHDFAAIPSGNVIKIVPLANAKFATTGEGVVAGKQLLEDFATRVIQIEHVSAVQLIPILRPIGSPQGHMAAHPQSNTLIVSDYSGNIDRLERILQRIDKPSSGEIEVIQLQNATAGEVVRVLTALRQQSRPPQPEMAATATSLVADDRTNSILLGGELSERLQLRSIIAHLDTPADTVGDTHVVYLRYAKAKDLLPVLTGVATGQDQLQQAGKPVPTQAASYQIQADENTNALVITAPYDVFKSLQGVIAKLDVRRAQVLVEAIIAEVSSEKASELGVQWLFDGRPDGSGGIGGISFSNGGINIMQLATDIAADKTPSIAADGLLIGGGRLNSSSFNFATLLRALAGSGSTNVLSTPSLVTLDNQQAEIVVGQTVPFLTGSFSSTTTGGSSTVSNPFQTINRENVGITLKVRPQINEGNTVKLEIEQKVDSISASSVGAVDLVTNTRSIKTIVMVDDGKTIVLGGLIKDDLIENVRKVPLLGDIPLLGALFRHKSTQTIKTNLMVFLQPTILRDIEDSARATDSKYSYIRAKQLEMQSKGSSLLSRDQSPVLPELTDQTVKPDAGSASNESAAEQAEPEPAANP